MIEAREQGKHLFIWDKSGQVPTYFAEFGIHKEYTEDMIRVALASKNNVVDVLDESLDSLRKSLVESLCSESPLLINLGML